jgi:hypothetical protein
MKIPIYKKLEKTALKQTASRIKGGDFNTSLQLPRLKPSKITSN